MKSKSYFTMFCVVSVLLALAQPVVLRAQQAAGLFDSQEILDLQLEYDLKKFSNDRGTSRGYHPAKLTYITPGGKPVTLDVRIMVRGNMRRQMLDCLVPMFKIEFEKSQTPQTIFENQESLKVVAHCKNKPDFYRYYTFQEYLVYKIYNILTGLSFRVRLARVTYNDTRKDIKSFTAYGFFIESYEQMVRRNLAKTVEVTTITYPQLDFETSTLVSVFEYMIGSTDWSMLAGHNIKLLSIGDNPVYFPVPYDFDQVGLIDAHYARPDLSLPIRSVRERLFRGYCKSEAQFNRTFEVFRKHKEEVIALYRDFAFLPDKIKKRSIKYLEEFYDIIANPKLVKRYFIDNYRGRPLPNY